MVTVHAPSTPRRQAATDEQLQMTECERSKPARPVAKCDGGIYISVQWTQPEDVADVTGYVVKYCNVHANVIDYATVEVAGNTTSFQFTDQLEEQTGYRFAIAAVNTTGRGEFSEFSDYVYTSAGEQYVLIHKAVSLQLIAVYFVNILNLVLFKRLVSARPTQKVKHTHNTHTHTHTHTHLSLIHI